MAPRPEPARGRITVARASVANRSRCRRVLTKRNRGVGESCMKPKNKPKERHESEPVGIVISGGPIRETEPLISAYVWGAAPVKPRPNPKPQAA